MAAAALFADAADPARVRITADQTAGSARLVLTHTQAVVYAVQSARGGRIRVTYSRPVIVDPPSVYYDGRVVDHYRQRDEKTLIIYTGPDFGRFESFELENPFRVVLDLQSRPGLKSPERLGRRKSR